MESTSGYQPEQFVSLDFKDRLICPICYLIPKDMVCCTEKEHFFCRECILQSLEKRKSCPCCRTYLTKYSLKRHSWAVEVMDKAKIQCSTIYTTSDDNQHYEGKCSWTGRVKVLDKHLLQCPFNLVSCPYDGNLQHLTLYLQFFILDFLF